MDKFCEENNQNLKMIFDGFYLRIKEIFDEFDIPIKMDDFFYFFFIKILIQFLHNLDSLNHHFHFFPFYYLLFFV